MLIMIVMFGGASTKPCCCFMFSFFFVVLACPVFGNGPFFCHISFDPGLFVLV